jgi:hypothetical protein
MSSITDTEKRYFEQLLGMQGGYVLDYSDSTFGEFFRRYNIDIHSTKYQTNGTSKARKLRALWERETDAVVGKVLNELLDSYEADCTLKKRELDAPVLAKSREITARLLGASAKPPATPSVTDFLHNEFTIPNIQRLPIDPHAVKIIESRLAEAKTTLGAGAFLATIFLCGSVLEAVLLGAAQKEPAKFNTAGCSPRDRDGSVKKFQDWNLAQFIDVACEVGLLKIDVKTFSHGLRDFRNYIHPYQQMASGFAPDEHTAKVCLQVLKAALASVAGERE